MKSFLKYLFYSFILFSISNNAQNAKQYNGLFSYKNNVFCKQNLKDSVKSVHMKFREVKQNLSEGEKAQIILFNDIRTSVYVYFDEFQRMKSSANISIPKQEYLFYDYEKSDDYEFKDKDWLEKSKYKIALKHYYPVCDHNLLVNLNQIRLPKKDDVYGKDGKVWQNYNEDIYIYMINWVESLKKKNIMFLG